MLEHLSAELAEFDANDPFHSLVSAFIASEHRDALRQAVTIRNRFSHGPTGELPDDKRELAALGEALVPLLRQGSLAFRALRRYRVVVPVDEGLSDGHARTSLRVLVGEDPLQIHVAHDARLVLRTPWLLSRQGEACRLDPWVVLRSRGRGLYLGVFARCTRSMEEADYSGQEEDFRAPWAPFDRVPSERVPIRLSVPEQHRVFGRPTGSIPEEVEDWRVVSELGRGSSAVVYAVRHQTAGEEAALKLIHAGQEASPLVQERWRREIDAMQRIQHPGVVRLLGEVTWQGRMGLVMERVKGESLTEYLRSAGPLSAVRVVRLGLMLLDALAAAHAAGVIHRDIKPSNILIGEQGEVRLVDFGIARLADSETLTGTMDVVGTLHYLAPE